MIREYLKLARISIAPITGLAPVMSALATGNYQVFHLLLLFLMGILVHNYGITHNDLIDYTIDKNAKEITDRPLVSGTISKRKAWVFALGCLFVMFVLAVFLATSTQQYLPLITVFITVVCVTLYNLISKKIPFADSILAIGMFFFILYGALSQIPQINQLPFLVWIMCSLGAIQLFSMNLISGGFKDIENDKRLGAKTGAVLLGLRITNERLYIPSYFKLIAYSLQLINISIAYLPFLLIPDFTPAIPLRYLQLGLITAVSISMIFFSHKYLNLSYFERGTIRKLINLHGYINFALAPILLMSITPFAIIIVIIPGIGFVISNLLLHEKFMEPSTM
ncbi:MAG: UbiA prenyltransferase family protein [Thermoplasmatales archaeon]|nr:MAG: UbiA prenyltransferase family protein [Thermoplasmatales archaeon]